MDFQTPINQIMTKDVMTAFTTDKVADFMEKCKRRGFHHIPVINTEEQILGIISTEDLKDNIKMLINAEQLLAEHIMTIQPKTINENATLISAINIFLENSFRALPVVDEKAVLKGIITIYDLVKELMKDYQVELALEDMEDIV